MRLRVLCGLRLRVELRREPPSALRRGQAFRSPLGRREPSGCTFTEMRGATLK